VGWQARHEQRDGESAVLAYAWDLQTNTRQAKTFTVAHVRDTKQGRKDLTDARDVYEVVANSAARRLRAELRVGQKGDVRRTRSVQWRDPGDVDLGIADQLPAQAIDQVA
jgi:hypothetical protein